MVVYFRGPCVRITHDAFEIMCPDYRVFPLDELAYPQVVEQNSDPPVARAVRTGSTGVAGATAAAAGLAWLEGWEVFASPLAAVTVFTLLIAAMLTSAACARARAIEQVLTVEYRGAPIVLFRSRDATAFGQVRRGLIRALNGLDDTR